MPNPPRGGRRLGQGAAREYRITISNSLLKWWLEYGSGQAAEPPAVGPFTVFFELLI